MSKPLTQTERLILLNQYRILEAVCPDNANAYKRAQSIVEAGYEAHYEDLYEGINLPPVTAEVSGEVLDILDLHRWLKESYDDLADKSGIDLYRIEFKGFDGNNEGEQLAYTRFFCAPGEAKYEMLPKGDNYNSHSQTLDWYRTKLRRWQAIGKPTTLTKEQILAIIANR